MQNNLVLLREKDLSIVCFCCVSLLSRPAQTRLALKLQMCGNCLFSNRAIRSI